jgi:hypothetical protein
MDWLVLYLQEPPSFATLHVATCNIIYPFWYIFILHIWEQLCKNVTKGPLVTLEVNSHFRRLSMMRWCQGWQDNVMKMIRWRKDKNDNDNNNSNNNKDNNNTDMMTRQWCNDAKDVETMQWRWYDDAKTRMTMTTITTMTPTIWQLDNDAMMLRMMRWCDEDDTMMQTMILQLDDDAMMPRTTRRLRMTRWCDEGDTTTQKREW